MKYYLITFIILFITFLNCFSQEVNVSEASIAAKNLYYIRINQYEIVDFNDIEILDHFTQQENGINIFHAFNMKPAGFVIISAQKKIRPVLAYSFESSINEKDQNPAVKAWLKQYIDQIVYAVEHKNPPLAEVDNLWKQLSSPYPQNLKILKDEKEVSPMLSSKWNQGEYYNQMCPYDPGGPGNHCVTGCVATAMGQLCYYFRWPDTGTGSYSYEHPNYGTISANFGETEYIWSGMSDELLSASPAAATLIAHMGISVDMDYGPGSSGMWNHKAAYSLRTYFKYSPESVYLYRDSTTLNWDSTIIEHLNQKIPMYYAGWSVPNVNGHAFIVDGYQTEEYFHFNWGWGGQSDGYFYLDNLTPGGSNFNNAQELVIHCYPDTLNYTYPKYCGETEIVASYTGSIDDGSGPWYHYQNNMNCSWLIAPQGEHDTVSNITLEFNQLDTEESSDILSIYDGPDTNADLLGQFSGNTLPGSITSSGNQLYITFETNESIAHNGWFISYTTEIPLWCDGMETFTQEMDTISDGSGEFFYQNDLSCVWLIEPEGANSVTLFFNAFETEEQFDKLEIYDGQNYTLLETYSGFYEAGNLPDPITSPSNKFMLLFKTDLGNTAPGWEVYYISDWTGAEERNFPDGLKVFPNPANNTLNLFLSNPSERNIEIQIFNSKSTLVLTQNLLGQSNHYQVNIENLSEGIYYLKVYVDDFILNRKIIVIH